MFWTEKFLAKRRAEWLQRVTKFQYLTTGVWKDAVITDKRVDGNALRQGSGGMGNQKRSDAGEGHRACGRGRGAGAA